MGLWREDSATNEPFMQLMTFYVKQPSPFQNQTVKKFVDWERLGGPLSKRGSENKWERKFCQR